MNRRSIVDSWNHCETVAEFNPQMDRWTKEHERVLNICLEALNESVRGTAHDRPEEDYDGTGPDLAPQD